MNQDHIRLIAEDATAHLEQTTPFRSDTSIYRNLGAELHAYLEYANTAEGFQPGRLGILRAEGAPLTTYFLSITVVYRDDHAEMCPETRLFEDRVFHYADPAYLEQMSDFANLVLSTYLREPE